MTTIGAYLLGETIQHWDIETAKTQFQLLKSYGVNTIFCEADSYLADIIKLAHDLDLRFMGGLTCFHNNDILKQHPDYHPVTVDGQPRPQMNWYIGVTPTHRDYQNLRLQALETMLKTYELDGLWLDFIRWSMHWELELRDDTPPPLETGFDSVTLRQFSDWSGLQLPEKQTANWILSNHREQWTTFRCHVIRDFVKRVHEIQTKHSHDKPLGINIVPATPTQRHELLGQDVSTLSQYADVVSPMVYHHILGRDVAWIQDTLDHIAAETDKTLIPFVQVSSLSNPDETNFPAQEWEQVVRTVLEHPKTDGLIAFTGIHLHSYNRGVQLAQWLNTKLW